MPWEKNIHAGNRALTSGLFEQAYQRFIEAIEEGKSFAIGDPLWGDAHRGLCRSCLALGRFAEAEQAAAIALQTDEGFWGSEYPTVAEDLYLAGEALRAQEKFEAAKSYYNRALAYWSKQSGDQNELSLQALSALLLLYFQSKRETGFAELHARAFAAYQASHPTGMWMKFSRLKEILDKYVERGDLEIATEILGREISVLSATVGRNHKEMKPFLEYQSQMLQQSKKFMAAWRVTTQIGKAQEEGLFFTDTCSYGLPAEQVISIMSNLLATRGTFLPANAPKLLHHSWWQISKTDVLANRLEAVLDLTESRTQATAGFGSTHKKGRIELAIKGKAHGSDTECVLEWRLQDSHDVSSTREIRRFTLEEFEQTFRILPMSNRPQRHSAAIEQPEGSRSWPTPQMYNEAIQNARQCFADPQLQNALPELNAIGLPRPLSGAFATVYRLSSPDAHWAVKCFTEPVTDQQARYYSISKTLCRLNLPFFVKFDYQPAGIQIQAQTAYPIVKMSWVEGQTLNVAVGSQLGNREILSKISAAFMQIVNTMESHGIAHGDLQHGNILVGANGLTLVDYDDMFVPDLKGIASNELGHRNYQHPGRSAQHFGPYLDNFSVWVIYVSLFVLARHPDLWESLECGDESLLFKQSDFTKPTESKAFNTLAQHHNAEAREAAATLRRFLSLAPENVPSVSAYFSRR